MSPLLIPILALLIPIVAILAGTYAKIAQTKAETAAQLGRATGHLEDELEEARRDRARLQRRLEALEAIVTSEGYDLEREALAALRRPAGDGARQRADSTRHAPEPGAGWASPTDDGERRRRISEGAGS